MDTKLRNLLLLMKQIGVDFLLLNGADEYQSGCILPSRQRIQWLCGFTGSNAFVVICGKGKSQFFTDSRYTIQSALEVDQADYELHDFRDKTPLKFLQEHLQSGDVVGYEGRLFTLSQIRGYGVFSLRLIDDILIDKLWKRTLHVGQDIVEHPIEYVGVDSREKCVCTARCLSAGDVLLITDVDAVSWLLNVRNMEFTYSPSVLSRAILHSDGTVSLFVDSADRIRITSPHITVYVMKRMQEILDSAKRIFVDASTIPMSIFSTIRHKDIEVREQDPCTLPRALKNSTEIQGAVRAHIRDGVALVNFLYWLHTRYNAQQRVTELEVGEKVLDFRKEQELFRGESFGTIAGFRGNGAIVHYRASEKSNKTIEGDGLLLLDSGGQYLDGTTDVTRTISFGRPTEEEKKNFTLVLKGHIALAQVVFPVGVNGNMLDVLARQYLWKSHLDYGHGTGHGVGSFLSVHEGPQAISRGGYAELMPGMILSNEPGYYKCDQYGIRIENLMYVESCGNGFCRFRQLTCVPLDSNLIDLTILSADEIEYVNSYHDFVYRSVLPYVNEGVRVWLEQVCKPL